MPQSLTFLPMRVERSRTSTLESAWICETRTLMCFSSPLRSLRTITPGRRPNCVTAGPWFTSTTLAGTPNLLSRSPVEM